MQQQPQQILCSVNYRPNVINTDNNYLKKSYNYMASPNYLQYENTYQKYKKICHSKDVTNFRDSNLSHCGESDIGGFMRSPQNPNQKPHNYQDCEENNDDNIVNIRLSKHLKTCDNVNISNTAHTLSSDDEGGFRRDLLNIIHNSNINNCNRNINYSTKEIEPLLQSPDKYECTQVSKVIIF